ncbi:MAG: hypothetical protein HOO97_00985 [Sideroxydans sp.]|nr:hypothetical protein [Sideroxydans sp.]
MRFITNTVFIITLTIVFSTSTFADWNDMPICDSRSDKSSDEVNKFVNSYSNLIRLKIEATLYQMSCEKSGGDKHPIEENFELSFKDYEKNGYYLAGCFFPPKDTSGHYAIATRSFGFSQDGHTLTNDANGSDHCRNQIDFQSSANRIRQYFKELK